MMWPKVDIQPKEMLIECTTVYVKAMLCLYVLAPGVFSDNMDATNLQSSTARWLSHQCLTMSIQARAASTAKYFRALLQSVSPVHCNDCQIASFVVLQTTQNHRQYI